MKRKNSSLPAEVQKLYMELDELRQRHPVGDVTKEELEVALVDDSKMKRKSLF
jgi:hypothetical protein